MGPKAMNIRQRLERLESERGGSDDGPIVIFICDAETGEPWSALVIGGDGPTREVGESAEAFEARAKIGLFGSRKKGSDALAIGKAP